MVRVKIGNAHQTYEGVNTIKKFIIVSKGVDMVASPLRGPSKASLSEGVKPAPGRPDNGRGAPYSDETPPH